MSIRNEINLEVLYRNEISSDVHFLLRSKNGGTIKIPAHKAILASRSSVFERMFWGNLNEGPVVNITDVHADAFCEFLQFFYLSALDLTPENIAEVLKLVDKYDVSSCFSLCESFLERTVTIEMVYLYYELALSFNMSPDVTTKFESIICKAPRKAFQAGPAGGSSQIVLRNILHSQKLKCDEIEIFDGALSWAIVSLTNKGESITTENIKAEFGECLYLIRFPLMSVAQFISCFERCPHLLNPEEYFDILCFIVNKRALSIASKFNTVRRGKSKKVDVWFSVITNFELVKCSPEASVSFRINRAANNVALIGFKIPKLITDHTICSVQLFENNIRKFNDNIILQPEDYTSDPEVRIFSCNVQNPIVLEVDKMYRLDVRLEQDVFRSFNIPTHVNKGDVEFYFGDNPSSYISQLNFEELL